MTTDIDPKPKPPSVGLELCSLLYHEQAPDLDEIRALVARGAELDLVPLETGGTDYYSYTPLQICVQKHHVDAMRLLLQLGADPKAANFLGVTALHDAARDGHEDMVQLLLAAKADPSHQTCGGMTPFESAAYRGQTHLLPELMVPGVDLNAVRRNGCTLLQDVLRQTKSWSKNRAGDAVQWLLDRGVDPNQKGGYVAPPLIDALSQGDWDHAQMLVRAGAQVNVSCALGMSAIHLAAWEPGGLETAKLLVEHGADLEARCLASGGTPLSLAAVNDDVLDMVRWLGHMGVNLEPRDHVGKTPLSLAYNHYMTCDANAEGGRDDRVMKQLLKLGAQIEDEGMLQLPFAKKRHEKATSRWQEVQAAMPLDVRAISADDLVLFANIGVVYELLAWPQWRAQGDHLRSLIGEINPSLQQTLLKSKPILADIINAPGRRVSEWSHEMAADLGIVKSP